MAYKNIHEERAYQKEYHRKYYHSHIKPKLNKQKWTISKKAWVKCPICSKNSQFKILKPSKPEVFAMLYGGRGMIKKYPESNLQKDSPELWSGIQKNYLIELKRACSRFIISYCTPSEIKDLFSIQELSTQPSFNVPYEFSSSSPQLAPSFLSSIPSFHIPIQLNNTTRMEATTKWQE
jgi:hypothetical protein